MKSVAIFKTGLLPPTQTFIPAQVDRFRTYTAVYVGLERVPGGHPLQSEPIVLVERPSQRNRVRKLLYKITGFSPRFHRRVRAARPDVLHAHFILDGVYALGLARSLKLPLLVSLHAHLPTSFGKALPRNSLDGRLFAWKLGRLWKRADVFICVSEFIRQQALRLGYPERKLRVHYIGVDRAFFAPLPLPRDPRLVFFVGRLEMRKGCNYLLDAMAAVQQQIPDARVVLMGDGSQRQALEQQAAALGVHAEFLGSRSDAEKREWMARARVFVGASVTAKDGDAEALGIVFAEAHAMALPVAAFRHGGVPEVVLDGRTGLLAEERDVPTLARNILRLLGDDALWESCSQNAAQWAEERFDLLRQTQELEQIYTSLAAPASEESASPADPVLHPS